MVPETNGISVPPRLSCLRCGTGWLLVRVGLGLQSARGAKIGHLNVIRGLEELSLGLNSSIGNANWLTGYPSGGGCHFTTEEDRLPGLQLGDEAAITSLHLLDCTNMITVGQFATVGGWRSQILTHSIDFAAGEQRSAPVSIGAYSFIGSGSVLLAGSIFPGHSVLGAHSCVTQSLLDEYWLYAGAPAQPVKQLARSSGYFVRTSGYVV